MSQPDTNPTMKKLRVLNLEDDENASERIRAELETGWKEIELMRVDTRDAFVRALGEFKPDVILCDLLCPGFDGRSALHIVRQTHPHIPVIIITDVWADSEAVKLVKMGAKNYVTKDRLQHLASAVQGALSMEQGARARKAAEKAVQQNEADFRALIERSPIATIVDVGWGADDKVTLMNKKFTELYGYTMEDIPDIRHWWPLAYPDEKYREEIKSEWAGLAIKAVQSHSDIEPKETAVTCKDGSTRYVRISLASIASGNIVTFEDLTERRQIEDALKEASDRNLAIMETANDAIICMKPDGIIYLWNHKAEELFGYTAREAVGHDLHQLIVPEQYREKALEGLRQFAKTGTGYMIGRTLELTAWHKGRVEFPIELSISPMNIHGEWHATGIIRDITERKQAEAELAANLERMTRLNEELQHANMKLKAAQRQLLQSEKMASIGLLAAGVAHEINNPVGYINSNLGTLVKYLADIFTVLDKYEEIVSSGAHGNQELLELQQIKKKLDLDFLRGDIKSLLAESREGLERIKKIVLGLKDFSHSSADEAWQWADLTKCLESTLAIVWNELKYKCEVVKEFGVLPQIYCLPSQLNQVFMNLLVNAAQAIETRGTITIRTGQEPGQVWVEISDTGAGIPPDTLPHIFDPFFTTKPVGSGTGLGLPVSYGIIERHHGKIEVHSEGGKGSTFRVILPVQPNIDKDEA